MFSLQCHMVGILEDSKTNTGLGISVEEIIDCQVNIKYELH